MTLLMLLVVLLFKCDKCDAESGHWPSCPDYPGKKDEEKK